MKESELTIYEITGVQNTPSKIFIAILRVTNTLLDADAVYMEGICVLSTLEYSVLHDAGADL